MTAKEYITVVLIKCLSLSDVVFPIRDLFLACYKDLGYSPSKMLLSLQFVHTILIELRGL